MAVTLSPRGARPDVEYTIVDPGVYTFELTTVREPRTEPNPFKRNDGSKKDEKEPAERTSVALEWTIRGDEEYDGEMVLCFYNLTLGTVEYPSALRPFVEVLSGERIDDEDEDAEFDLESYVGQRIQATLVHKQKKAGGTKMVLTAPVPIRKKKKAAPTPEPESEVEDDEDVFA